MNYSPEDEREAEEMARQGLLGQGTVHVRQKVAARLAAARSQGRGAADARLRLLLRQARKALREARRQIDIQFWDMGEDQS